MSASDDARHHREQAINAVLEFMLAYTRAVRNPAEAFLVERSMEAHLAALTEHLEAAAVAAVLHRLLTRAEGLPDSAAKGALLSLLKDQP